MHGDHQCSSAEGVGDQVDEPFNPSMLYWVHCMSAVWTTCIRGSGDWMSY